MLPLFGLTEEWYLSWSRRTSRFMEDGTLHISYQTRSNWLENICDEADDFAVSDCVAVSEVKRKPCVCIQIQSWNCILKLAASAFSVKRQLLFPQLQGFEPKVSLNHTFIYQLFLASS